MKDDQMGQSIPEVEELIRRHDDFLKTIDAQEDKLDLIKRMTMVSLLVFSLSISFFIIFSRSLVLFSYFY